MSTKVFEVLPDYAYQGLVYDGRDDPYNERFAPLSFDGTRRADVWEPPVLFSPWPDDLEGDIWHAVFPVLGDSATAAALQPVLLRSAELLPLPYEGRMFHAINVITMQDCFDAEAARWRNNELRRYEFIEDRLPDTVLFKTPHTRNRIFCAHLPRSMAIDFMAIYEDLGATGWQFDEVWDSETGPAPTRLFDEAQRSR